MKNITWNEEKNKILIESREISFEEVMFYIENDEIVDVIYQPNQKKYANQKMFVIEKEGYIYLVSYVENEDEIFLKTIYPSRQATKKYLGNNL